MLIKSSGIDMSEVPQFARCKPCLKSALKILLFIAAPPRDRDYDFLIIGEDVCGRVIFRVLR